MISARVRRAASFAGLPLAILLTSLCHGAVGFANPALGGALGALEAGAGGTPSPQQNRLADAASPYLRQHADNPIDWYPWGDAAAARAADENKLIFLSIGYSTCYWCHVMEREVFSNAETAAVLNANFISILVDNEERRDLDRIYMPVRLLNGGETGWPLSVFLTPDLQPILAAGYIPNDEFQGILESLAQGWRADEALYRSQADMVTRLVEREQALVAGGSTGGLPDRALLDTAAGLLARDYDTMYGGFDRGPKFPRPPILEMLLALAERGAEPAALAMAEGTLDGMAAGAIHDQLGGGFHRYTSDLAWLEPHFEKMLYDNAMLLRVYARAYAITENPRHARVARGIAAYVAREMTDDAGLFRTAQDSETDEVEGAYYLWSREELSAVLATEELIAANAVFAVGEGPAFGDQFALGWANPVDDVAIERRIDAIRDKLLEARDNRVPPFRDDKVIAGWNGLMIEALAYSAGALDNPEYLRRAARAGRSLLDQLVDATGNLVRVASSDAPIPAQLDDYSGAILGLAELYEATGNAIWLDAAGRFGDQMVDRFGDPEGGAFFDVAANVGNLVVRPRTTHDTATPAGNSLAVRALDRLASFGRERFDEPATGILAAFAPTLSSRPDSLPYMLAALEARYAAAEASAADPMAEARSSRVVRLEASVDTARSMLVATLAIDDGWHVNANPAAFDFLIPTVLATTAVDGPDLPDPAYPDARTLDTPLGPFTVYEDGAEITIALPADVLAAADSIRFRLELRTQACDDEGVCLLPATLEATVFF